MSNKRWFISLMLLLLVVMASFKVYALDDTHFNKNFKSGMDAASLNKNNPSDKMRAFKPERFIENYSSNPKEANYLNNNDAMKSDSINARDHDEAAKAITKSITTHPKFDIDPTSSAMKQIEKKADDIYEVVTGQYGDCTKQQSCKVVYETKSCEETPKTLYSHCQNALSVGFVAKQVDTHYPLILHLTTSDHNYAGVNVNVFDGKINYAGPHDAHFTLEGRIPNSVDCNGIHGTIKSVNNKNPQTQIDYVNFPSCTAMNVDFHVSGSGTVNIDIQLDIVSSQIIQEPVDHWEDGCIGFENSSECHLQEEHCIESNETHDVQGTSIYRDCWVKESSYQCGGNDKASNCQPLRDQGCEQTNSVCESKQDGSCQLFMQSFQCPSKKCTDTGVICNGETYCLSGDCIKQSKQADPDFQKAIAGLSAVDEATKSYQLNPNQEFSIFGGVTKTCNKDFLDFANCCSDDGWGVDLHLGQCDQEAKDLGEAKAKGLTSYIDSETNCPIGGLCSHKKKYCVFPSKLARILQEQGRRDQLHVSFGNFDNPDCRGVSPDEFSKLDIKIMDLSEFYADISAKEKVEDQEKLKQRLQLKMSEWIQDGKANG
jgi:conjugal transfer mating pair stabilization protein TraN